MISFIIKGLLRDKSRSLLQIIIVTTGVFLTVSLSGYVKGLSSDMISENARLKSGHVKITTKDYLNHRNNLNLESSLCNTKELLLDLNKNYPDFDWIQRIYFGGIIKSFDKNANLTQGPFYAMAINLISENTDEIKRLNLNNALIKGNLIQKNNEIIIGYQLAEKAKLSIGDTLQLFTNNKYGKPIINKYCIIGIVKYGILAMDKRLVIMDLNEAQKILEMGNCSAEILGFSKDGFYDNANAARIQKYFNMKYYDKYNPKSPYMSKMKDDKEF